MLSLQAYSLDVNGDLLLKTMEKINKCYFLLENGIKKAIIEILNTLETAFFLK